MADVATPDFILTAAAATAEPAVFLAESAPRSVETPTLTAPVDQVSADMSTNTSIIISQQQQPAAAAVAQLEADRMPTPVSDEPADETRPAPVGEKHAALDNEQDSELSDPDSTVRTPPRVSEEEIIVASKAGRNTIHLAEPASAAAAAVAADEDESMADVEEEPLASHYPKRKRTSIFNDLSESKIEIPTSTRAERAERTALPSISIKVKPRNSLGGVKGVLVGHWRDSPVPELENKHAVIGFIDVRDRLRTRIQPMNKNGETISHEYPLPPGPGGSWVTFDRIYFSEPLVGLDHYQVKEYVRMRTDVVEATDDERLAAEKAAVKAATVRGRELLQKENPVVAPAIAYGAIPIESSLMQSTSDGKRRRTSSSFVAIASQDDASGTAQHPMVLDPLHGTRPTRIVLGFWRGSSESNSRDRHAVYGILGQNDMFRVKVVRETRDGRYVDGNFPSGAGALWIHYDEVEFEPHLKDLSRPEIKEYCRIRQYQVDHGETGGERKANEDRAAVDARVRATAYLPTHHLQGATVYGKAYPYRDADNSASATDSPGGRVSGGHELRQLRRPESRSARHSFSDAAAETSGTGTVTVATTTAGTTSSGGRMPSAEAIERANALARREIARVEAAQGRADRHAVHRERAAQAADAAAASAAASVSGGTTTAHSPTMTNGHVGVAGGSRGLFHESEDIERLNRVWARQERLRATPTTAGGGIEEAKFYDGVKYERKPTGPFMGKLVSQGTIITIDGEDYVEYRVLTKPSFF